MHFEFVTRLGDAVARCTIPINLGRVKISDFPMIDAGVDGGVTGTKPLTTQAPPTPGRKMRPISQTENVFGRLVSPDGCSGRRQKLPTYVVLAGTAN